MSDVFQIVNVLSWSVPPSSGVPTSINSWGEITVGKAYTVLDPETGRHREFADPIDEINRVYAIECERIRLTENAGGAA